VAGVREIIGFISIRAAFSDQKFPALPGLFM
jgi:hypothetical protein